MNFDLDEDQQLLKAAAERFVADSGGGDLLLRRAARLEPSGFSAANWTRLAESGVLGLAVSAENGGLGQGTVEIAIVMEALGRGLVPEPVLDIGIIAAGLIDNAENAAQHKSLLQDLIRGNTLVSLAHSEREARHSLGWVGASARPDGKSLRLDGCKVAVMAGGSARHFIVSARLSGAPGDADGIGLFVVPADATGLERRPYRLADGSLAAELTLRNVEIPVGAQLAGGFAALEAVAATARLAAAAEMLGVMGLLFDNTLSYVKTRQQFGQPLGNFQVIQHRMTDAYVQLEQSRSHVMRAALAEGTAFAGAAAGAKAFVAEAALSLAHTAVQMHGGMGITDELAIGHGLKRIRVLALCFGDSASALDDYRRAA